MEPRKEILAEGIEIWLGDCREVLPLLGTVDAIVTDPPYGIRAVLGMGGGSKGDGGMWRGVAIEGDDDTSARDSVLNLARTPFASFAKINTLPPAGTRATVIWDKGEHTGAGDLTLPWKPHFEVVFIGGFGWNWPSRGSSIIKVNAVAGCVADRNDGRRFHPFEKPVAIMRHFCERAPGKTILDPFMGSGTTGVVAIKLGRRFIGIEIESRYYETAKRRISEALKQPDLFIEKPKQAVQDILL